MIGWLKKKISSRKWKRQEEAKADEGKNLAEMSRKEKKIFLSMDLIERMVRIEQRVSASFNKKVSYKRTEYYKSLTKEEREAFEKYLKEKKRRKFLLAGLFFAPLAFLMSIKSTITGNAIKQAIGSSAAVTLIENGLLLFVLIFCACCLIVLLIKRARNKKLGKNFEILEDIFLKKYAVRHLN